MAAFDSTVRTVTASGLVRPAATTPVVARVTGVIQTLGCDVKMKVKAGQVCATIDPRPYQILVDRTKSDLAGAEARLEKDKMALAQAKAAFEHLEARAKRRAVSQKAIDKLGKAYEQAQARTALAESTVGQFQAALHVAETNLGSTDIVSPIDGVILSRNVKIGQTVEEGPEISPLYLVATDLAVIDVDAEVGEKDIGEVEYGDRATFTVEVDAEPSFYRGGDTNPPVAAN